MAELRRKPHIRELEAQSGEVDDKQRRGWPLRRVMPLFLLTLLIFVSVWWLKFPEVFVEPPRAVRTTAWGALGKVAFVFIAHDRPEYLRDSMASVFAARQLDEVDVIVSMDYPSQFSVLESVVAEFASAKNPVSIWYNVMPGGNLFFQTSDDRITYHHRLIFERVFADQYDYAILLESDLMVSPDFIEYLFATGHLLNPTNVASESLFCISGWNDNGMNHLTLNESRLYRTDFFPGLGWMLHRSMWTEVLVHEWPSRVGNYAYDIWLREGASTRTRDCIAPEVPRTHHFSKYGSHVNGKGHIWYDNMRLASGNVSIPTSEIELVASLAAFEDRIKREAIVGAQIVPISHIPFKIPYKKSILVVVKDQVSWIHRLLFGTPANYFKDVNEVFGLYNTQMRASHKGLNRVTLDEKKHGKTNVTLVSESMVAYWM